MLTLEAHTELAQEALGHKLAQAIDMGAVVYLHGALGTGKTTLVRGILRALGHVGNVKSPTYTLLELYQLESKTVVHLDLYRLKEPEEYIYLGLEDLTSPDTLWLLEWPEHGANFVPPADMEVSIIYQGTGRRLVITALSTIGTAILNNLQLNVGYSS
ncbi:hypothetical protein TI05_00780 [Achromatium sp. WMS3]|nr:hypothetical protein TI05_00780 [Achromatium sp. WMS3]